MELMWYLCQRISESDILNGRFTPLDEVLRSVVECAEFHVDEFMHKECYCYHDYHKQLKNFLLQQLVLLCEAKSILRMHTEDEIDMELPSRVVRVYAAMRHEFDKGMDSKYHYPMVHNEFGSAVRYKTGIECFDQREYLGFDIFEEYRNILPTVSKFVDYHEFEAFYSDYVVKIHDMVFQCFMVEEDRLAEESCQREQASFAGKVVRFKATAERREEIHSAWRKMVYDTYHIYDKKMKCVRVSDVSKDFDRFWRTKMRSH